MKNKTSKYGNQTVYAIPYHLTTHLLNGYTHITDKDIWRKFDNLGSYVYRDDAEGSILFQQLIPYILIRDITGRFYVTKRINKEDTKNTISLGFGDHIVESDGYKELLFKATVRQLIEEVNLQKLQPVKHIGYVRSLNSSISDHLGIVFLLDNINEEDVSIRYRNNLVGEWMTQDQLVEHYAKLESWSKHILDYILDNPI